MGNNVCSCAQPQNAARARKKTSTTDIPADTRVSLVSSMVSRNESCLEPA